MLRVRDTPLTVSHQLQVEVPVSFPLLYQVNNTDLSHGSLAKMVGLTANVTDVAGNAVFFSDHLEFGKGTFTTLTPDTVTGSGQKRVRIQILHRYRCPY